MKRSGFFLALSLLAASVVRGNDPTTPQRLLVWVPQTDDQAIAAMKRLDEHPSLRVVWAMSPRFFRLAKDDALKARILEAQTQGRLALALQIPNAPNLALLMNTDEARLSLPPNAVLPAVPYNGTDDVIQHLANAKAGFTSVWGIPPKGLVVPYGAVSPALMRLLERQGFDWVVAAVGAGLSSSGPVCLGGLLSWNALPFWDGAGVPESSASFGVLVWDERDRKESGGLGVLAGWAKMMDSHVFEPVLPGDPALPAPQKISDAAVQRRAWTQPDWSAWIGSPGKNAIWSALRKTRAALDTYQNSGAAQVQRLDGAWQEFLTAENSNYMILADSPTLSSVEQEDHRRDLEATLGNAYRLIGQVPPDDLLASDGAPSADAPTTVQEVSERWADGRDHLRLSASGLAMDVVASSDTLTWTVRADSATPEATLDVYIDINGLVNVGLVAPLQNRTLAIDPEDAWEYALSLTGAQATLSRTRGDGGYRTDGTFPVQVSGHAYTVVIPRDQMRGALRRWGYHLVIWDKDWRPLGSIERKYG